MPFVRMDDDDDAIDDVTQQLVVVVVVPLIYSAEHFQSVCMSEKYLMHFLNEVSLLSSK